MDHTPLWVLALLAGLAWVALILVLLRAYFRGRA